METFGKLNFRDADSRQVVIELISYRHYLI